MDEEKTLTNLSITSFWHRGEESILALYNTVRIEKVTEDADGAVVHFSIRPEGLDFLESMDQGHVKVRYDAVQPNNPFSGELFMTLENLQPFQIAAHGLDSASPVRDILFVVKAKCVLTWGIIKSPIKRD